MQQFATKTAAKTPDGQAFRKQIGLDVPSLDPAPLVAPNLPMPKAPDDPLVGYSADDPRNRLRKAGQAPTILSAPAASYSGTKLG